jgi:gamma-glutamyltranspeptidase/glutathione hydrolase
MGFGAEGAGWAIATPHMLATDAGARAFDRGGNAIDAALAAAVTLAVSYPHMCGVGGDLFALVQLEDGRTMAVNASGAAPSGTRPDELRARWGDAMPEHGPDTVTVPGAVSGWAAVHGLGARLPWETAFDAGLEAATRGVTVSHDLARTLVRHAARLRDDPGLADVFFPGGEAPAEGDPLHQRALGDTLREIAEGGPDVLYGGQLGHRYAHGLRGLGVPIRDDDLGGHRAEVLPALSARYRDLHVSVAPPNSQGFALLELLLLIERLGIPPDPLSDAAGTIALAIGAVAADRDEHLADSASMSVHPHTLLDEGHIAGLADEVREGRLPGEPLARATGDTIALVTADASGAAVSLIQSLYSGFGSGLLEPSTGIVAHSRGACFTLRPGHVNEPAPGKRPAHTLMPVTVHRAGKLAAVAGTMGGHAQPQINASVLMGAFDRGMTPEAAVGAPRWLAWGMDPSSGARVAWAEADVPADARDALETEGFAVVEAAEHDTGHAHLIAIGPSGFVAGSDPRADGGALAG